MPDYVGFASYLPVILCSLVGIGIILQWMVSSKKRWFAIPEMWLLVHLIINSTVMAISRLAGSDDFTDLVLVMWGGALRLHVVLTMLLYYLAVRAGKNAN